MLHVLTVCTYLLDTHRHKNSVQRPCKSRFVSRLGKNHRNKNPLLLENLSKYSQFSVFHVQKSCTFIILSFVYCPILAFFVYFRRLCYSLHRKRGMTESIKINKSWKFQSSNPTFQTFVSIIKHRMILEKALLWTLLIHLLHQH